MITLEKAKWLPSLEGTLLWVIELRNELSRKSGLDGLNGMTQGAMYSKSVRSLWKSGTADAQEGVDCRYLSNEEELIIIFKSKGQN